MKQSLVIRALLMAINLRNPPHGLIHHSDRGSQYASHAYQQLLKQRGMVCSMSRKGNCWDNSPTERFFSSLKREWLTGNVYQTRESAIADTHTYIGYYNTQRIHTTIGDMTPIEFEKGLNCSSSDPIVHLPDLAKRLSDQIQLFRVVILSCHTSFASINVCMGVRPQHILP